MQQADALVSRAGLLQRDQSALLWRAASAMHLQSPILLRVWRVVARPGALQMAQKVDQKMWRRLGDVQLDSGQHQGVSQVSGDHRKERRLQSHDLQESGVPRRILLGVLRRLGAARLLLVQLQPLQRGRRQEGARQPRKVALHASTLPALLQPLHESSPQSQAWAEAGRLDQGQDGGDAAAQHVLDRGAVPAQGRRRALPMPPDAHVHVRVRVLFEKE